VAQPSANGRRQQWVVDRVARVDNAEDAPMSPVDEETARRVAAFRDPNQEWRRLFSELFGTFLLVVVAAGGGVVAAVSHGAVSRSAEVAAPGLTVMAVILFMGKVSGAHLNPVVSLAFAMRGDFPWRRVPGYVGAQLVGATFWAAEAVPRIVLTKPTVSSVSINSACQSLIPGPGSVAPSPPTFPKTAMRNRHANVAPTSWAPT
jgi:hypothetical protein